MNIFVEDRISALLTKDKNKLKVYTDSYDGHCLRAYSYFGEKMQDIKQQLDAINGASEVKKITYSDGSVEYIKLT